MNKYDIALPNNTTLSLFYNTIEEVINNVNKFGYNITKENIKIDTELDYMKYINEIIDNSDGVIYIKNKKHYLYKSSKGLIPVNLWEQNNFFFNELQYIEGKYDITTKTIKPFEGDYMGFCGWISCSVKEFLELFSDNNKLSFKIHSYRKYGQPKLSKPTELKGIKQICSVDYILKKCRCQIFIKDKDVWIKHGDYFSPSMEYNDEEDVGMQLHMLCQKYGITKNCKKFVYADAWGDIVLRNEAWICLENLVSRLSLGDNIHVLLYDILQQQEKIHLFKKDELINSDMSKFWEKVINEVKTYLKNNN